MRALFGVPGGGGNLDLVAAAGRASLPFVLTATETAAAISALAQSELTGQPGACLTTLGPGAASAVNGIACAWLDRAPVVAFTDSHAEGKHSPFEHQRLDHAALLGPVTRGELGHFRRTGHDGDGVRDRARPRAAAWARPGRVSRRGGRRRGARRCDGSPSARVSGIGTG